MFYHPMMRTVVIRDPELVRDAEEMRRQRAISQAELEAELAKLERKREAFDRTKTGRTAAATARRGSLITRLPGGYSTSF